jgi:general secretion pathway protein I
LAVVATAAVAVIELNSGSERSLQQLEGSVYARIVADNQMALALAMPGPLDRGDATGEEEMAGRTWSWSRIVSSTVDPDIDRIDITVSLEGEEQAAARLPGFRGLR